MLVTAGLELVIPTETLNYYKTCYFGEFLFYSFQISVNLAGELL